MNWSPSTLRQYNTVVQKFCAYCVRVGKVFPCASEQVLSDYLCEVGHSSPRPRSQLNVTLAALRCMYDALNAGRPLDSGRLQALVRGITKSCTLEPMRKTPVMPIDKFVELFELWPENDVLTIKELRLKVICLIALVFMLRPSDIAPHGLVMDSDNSETTSMSFSEDQVEFTDAGMSFTFHAIKNDSSRDGFKVSVPRASNAKVDPVAAMEAYMRRTASIRASIPGRPVFLALQRPYKGLSASAVAKVLNSSIELAGLGGQGFSAKCFRPTGATKAVDSGLKPDTARHIGRWANPDVFEKHYLHTRVPDTYVDKVLS